MESDFFFLFSPPYILLFRSVKTRARMQSSGKHCLKWNNFQENFKSAFGVLRNDQDFANVIRYVSLSFGICGKVSRSKKDWDFTNEEISLDHSTGGLDIHNVRSQEAGLKLDIILRIREGLRVTNLWECTGEGAIQENYKTKISISCLLKTKSKETSLK